MKPSSFDLIRPESWEEATKVLKKYGDDAQIIAGGQSLIAMLNMRIAKPSILIDINFIKGGHELICNNDTIEISALYTQLNLETRIETKEDLPLIAEALPYIGHQQHRARGTIVGSICHSDPSSELPLCILALKGVLKLNSFKGKRTVKAKDFFLGPLLNSKRQDEIVQSVLIPKAKKYTGYAFNEVSEKHGDFALASFAAIVDQNNTRLAVGGVCEKPVVREWTNTNIKNLSNLINEFAWDLEIISDQHSTDKYKRALIRNIGIETIRTAKRRLSIS